MLDGLIGESTVLALVLAGSGSAAAETAKTSAKRTSRIATSSTVTIAGWGAGGRICKDSLWFELGPGLARLPLCRFRARYAPPPNFS